MLQCNGQSGRQSLRLVYKHSVRLTPNARARVAMRAFYCKEFCILLRFHVLAGGTVSGMYGTGQKTLFMSARNLRSELGYTF